MNSRGGGGAPVARYCDASPCACLGGAVLLDESPDNKGPDELVGGDRHSVELIEARNQSGNPKTLLDFFESTGCLVGVIPANNR